MQRTKAILVTLIMLIASACILPAQPYYGIDPFTGEIIYLPEFQVPEPTPVEQPNNNQPDNEPEPAYQDPTPVYEDRERDYTPTPSYTAPEVSNQAPPPSAPSYTAPASSNYNTDWHGEATFKAGYQQFGRNEHKFGLKQFNKGNYAAAVHHFKTALKFDPDCNSCRSNLAMAEAKLEEQRLYKAKLRSYRDAMKEQEKYLRKKENPAVSANEKAMQYMQKQLQKGYEIHQDQIASLNKALGGYDMPPLPENPKHHKEGIMLGFANTVNENTFVKDRSVSPISGEVPPFYPTASTASPIGDAYRILSDHLTKGAYSIMYSKEFRDKYLTELVGSQFDVFMAHSNGATVAECLIQNDLIKVDELQIIGGDRSLCNAETYKKMLEEKKVNKIVVWINPADPVPMMTSDKATLSSKGVMSPHTYWMTQIKKLESEKGNLNIEYRILDGPEYPTRQSANDPQLDAHFLKTYLERMEIWYANHPTKTRGQKRG